MTRILNSASHKFLFNWFAVNLMACMLINIFIDCTILLCQGPVKVLHCLQEIFVHSYYHLSLFKQKVIMYSALAFLQIK